MKRCVACGEIKSLAEFGVDRRKRDGATGRCRPCLREYRKRWYGEHPDYQRAAYERNRTQRLAAQKAAREADLDGARARARERYRANPEPQRVRSRKRNATPEARAQTKAWQREHPERVRALSRKSEAKRRAQKRGSQVEEIDPQEVFKRDAGICGICGGAVDPRHWHLDHIVPLARGGGHLRSNVQVAHPNCNLRKGAKVERNAA